MPKRSRTVAVISVLLCALFVLTAPIAALTSGLRTQFATTDGFVAALAPLATDPDIQADLAAQAVAAIESQVSLDELAASGLGALFSGDRVNLSAEEIGLLSDLLAGAARDALTSAVADALASPQFASAWEQTLRLSHTAIDTLLADSGRGVITLDDGGTLSIQLGPIIDYVVAQLSDRGYAWAQRIPHTDREIELVQADGLSAARTVYQGIDRAGTLLPWVAVALAVLGVALAAGSANVRARRFRTAAQDPLAAPEDAHEPVATTTAASETDSPTTGSATVALESDAPASETVAQATETVAQATVHEEVVDASSTQAMPLDSHVVARASWRAGARWLGFAAAAAALVAGALEIAIQVVRGVAADAVTDAAPAVSRGAADATLRAVTGDLSYSLLGTCIVLAVVAIAAFALAFAVSRFGRARRAAGTST